MSGLDVRAKVAALGAAALLALAVACASDAPEAPRPRSPAPERGSTATPPMTSAAAWPTIFDVLQHPRCMNCHPVGDRPLQGDDSHPHVQNVQRGPDGKGWYALRCDACHGEANLDGDLLPPGAPGWHLPPPDVPMVFEGVSSADLCRQLADPKKNGGRTPEDLLHHMTEDELVLWGWDPGGSRTPVSTPQPEFAAAVRAWVEGGCGCPD